MNMYLIVAQIELRNQVDTVEKRFIVQAESGEKAKEEIQSLYQDSKCSYRRIFSPFQLEVQV